jgi:hypothetical protein
MSPLKKTKVKSIRSQGVYISNEQRRRNQIKFVLYLLGLFVISAVILIGGPRFSRYLYGSMKKQVDKNGAIIKAIVYKKSSHKGRSVSFKYFYKGKEYKNSDGSGALYEDVDYGETIDIKIDTLNPEDSYVIGY